LRRAAVGTHETNYFVLTDRAEEKELAGEAGDGLVPKVNCADDEAIEKPLAPVVHDLGAGAPLSRGDRKASRCDRCAWCSPAQ
jgi:hypothetical protein